MKNCDWCDGQGEFTEATLKVKHSKDGEVEYACEDHNPYEQQHSLNGDFNCEVNSIEDLIVTKL